MVYGLEISGQIVLIECLILIELVIPISCAYKYIGNILNRIAHTTYSVHTITL